MRSSLILLPAVGYILFTLVFYRGTSVKNICEALVKGYLVLFLFIAISTELLSLANGISYPVVLISWFLFLLVGFLAAFRHLKKHSLSLPKANGASPLTVILIGAIAFILLSTLITAIVYPPNTWDSMTYHMPRVLHWINNNNVSFYPTEISRQNYQMPLAEFAIMHLQILTGGDWYANLVQWMSFLVLICLGVAVAAELGLGRKLQLITAIIVATLPMAILQASSTQNDLVVSVFLMSFVLFMLRLRLNLSTENLLFAAISLGLALLTKGTAYLYGAALGISLAIPLLLSSRRKESGLIKTTAALTLIVIIALVLNTGHFWRNYQLYGHPLSAEADDYRNQDMSLTTLGSNILRNGALHLGTPYEQVNLYQLQLLHYLLGSKLNDPNTTWPGTSFSIPFSNHEDLAGNLIHMVVAVIGAVLLIALWFQGRHRKSIWYTVGILFGAGIYCWVLKWQPWATRLHTPLFVLAAPLLAIAITSDIATKRIGYLVCLLMILYSVPFALDNPSRSLVSLEWRDNNRMQLYFQNKHYLYRDYNAALNVLKSESDGEAGLYLGLDDWEYPLWVLAGREEENGRRVNFKSVGVNNVSRTIWEYESLPTHVIATKPMKDWEHASKYEPIYSSNLISVFRLAQEPEEPGSTSLIEGRQERLLAH